MSPQTIKSLKRLGAVAFILFIAVLIISAVEQQENDIVKAVEIQISPLPDGHLLIDEEDVRTVIRRSFSIDLEKQKLGLVNIEFLEEILEAEPFVLDAEAFVNNRDVVHISIIQREPILRVFDKKKQSYYLDKEGKKLPTSKHFTTRSLVATGDIPPYDPNYLNVQYHRRKDNVIKDLYQLTQFILKDEFWKAMIEQIHVKEGEYILIPKIGKQRVIFGKFSDIEDKFNRLKVFYEEGMNRVGWTKYREIDIRFKGQVIGR